MTPLESFEERSLVTLRLAELRQSGLLTSQHVVAAADGCGVHRSTVYRWIENGVPQPRSNAYKLTERDKVAYFMACGSAALAFREMVKKGDGAPPSLSTYERALRREFDRATRAAAKHGARARKQLRVAHRDRNYHRNERWDGDHTQLDIEVVVPGRKEPARPWLTWFIDAGSRYIVGWAVSLRPTSGEVLAVLRAGIEKRPELGPVYGAPKILVWDNGYEFLANAVTEAGLMLGSYTAVAQPHSPETKGKVERVHRTLKEELLATLPYYTKGPRKKDGTLYGPPGGRLSLEMLVAEVAKWIDSYNADRPCGPLGGLTPEAAWLQDPTPVRFIPDDELRRFTMKGRFAVVSHDGGVTVDRRTFMAPPLHGLVRERVEVRMMPHDYSRVEIYDLKDRWICTAWPIEEFTADQIRESKAVVAEMNRESGRLLAKRTKLLREKYAPMTADEPTPRSLPPDPALRKAGRLHKDPLDFGEAIGEVD